MKITDITRMTLFRIILLVDTNIIIVITNDLTTLHMNFMNVLIVANCNLIIIIISVTPVLSSFRFGDGRVR